MLAVRRVSRRVPRRSLSLSRSLSSSTPSSTTSPKSDAEQLFHTLSLFLSRQAKRLFVAMTTRRRLSLPFSLPFCRCSGNTHSDNGVSLSDLAGHGSFLFLALSYLETDLLALRLYAASGITLSILFQFYRTVPLWIPIRWNSLFLVINAAMVLSLLKEEQDAQHLPDDQRTLYKRLFAPRGMSPVQFMHLMSLATRAEPVKGTRLVDERKQNSTVFLVVNGSLSVRKKGHQVGTIQESQFVGAMSFLTYQTKRAMRRSEREREGERHRERDSVWDDDERGSTALRNLVRWLRGEREIERKSETLSLTETHATEDTHTETHTHTDTQTTPPHTQQLTTPHNTLTQQPTHTSQTTHSNPHAQQGYADVICEEDCVLYSWRFQDLQRLLDEHPALGLVFERCISDDLNRKMTSSWEEEIQTRYRKLLAGALCGGEVGESAKGMLEKFRSTYGVSEKDHMGMVRDLGWSRESFEAGFKDAPKAAVIAEYEVMLKREISGPFGLSDEGRDALRQYRLKHGITSEIQLHCLRKLGWTFDDFELGAKSSEVLKRRQYMSKEAQLSNITAAVTEVLLEKNDVLLQRQAALAFEQERVRVEQHDQALARAEELRREATHLRRTFPVVAWVASWFVSLPSAKDESTSRRKSERESVLFGHRPDVFMNDDDDTPAEVAARLMDKEIA